MPSVRVLQSNVQADVVGFVRCWNDSAPLISARLPAGTPPVATLDINDSARIQALVQSRNYRTYGYDTSDEANGLPVAGILNLHHSRDLLPEDDGFMSVHVTMAAIRKRAGEGLAVLRPRLRRTLFRCLMQMALDAQTLAVPVRIIAEYPDVADAEDGGPVTLRTFLTEMAQRNGKVGYAANGYVRWSGGHALTPQDVITGLTGLIP